MGAPYVIVRFKATVSRLRDESSKEKGWPFRFLLHMQID